VNLNCPNCGNDNTQKLSLLLNQTGREEMEAKGTKLIVFYGRNIVLPLMTVIFACLIGFMFALFSTILGFVAFVAILFGGFTLRKWLKVTQKPRSDSMSPGMKRDGFQCNRCGHLFIPAQAVGV
jgi:hypothetical protein